jgi:hypothetical protein
VLFTIAGIGNLIWGLHALEGKSAFPEDGVIYASLETWGWIAVIWSAIVLVTAGLLYANKGTGVGLGIMVAMLSAAFWFFVLPVVPVFALTVIVLDSLVIYGLAVYGTAE